MGLHRRGIAYAVIMVIALLVALGGSSQATASLRVGVFGADSVVPVRGEPFAMPARPPSQNLAPPSRPDGEARASHSPVPNPTAYPFSTHGKIRVAIGGGAATCSGTVINTPNRSMMVTAGHCVRQGFGRRGSWAKKLVFIPAYNRGRRPYGTFEASAVWVPRGFWRDENTNYDVGIVKLRPNSRGRVADVAGARGWMANVARNRWYRVFGYPAGRMRGEVQRSCTSRAHGTRNFTRFFGGPTPTRIQCDMARGSSGGGWIFGGKYLNGVISYSLVGQPEVIYGPYFGRDVRRLIERHG